MIITKGDNGFVLEGVASSCKVHGKVVLTDREFCDKAFLGQTIQWMYGVAPRPDFSPKRRVGLLTIIFEPRR